MPFRCSLLFLLIISFAVVSSCDLLPCTNVGCVEGLVINVDIDPESEAVLVLYGAEARSQTINCGGEEGDDCRFLVFDAFPVKYYQATVTRADGSTETLAESVLYMTVYPNGKRCDPECRQASIEIVDD